MKIRMISILNIIAFMVLTAMSSFSKNIDSCIISYQPKLTIEEKFATTLKSDDFNFLPLKVSEFVSGEFNQILLQYEKQLDLLRKVGDKNVLISAMNTSKIALDKNAKALDAISKTQNPGLFSFNQLVSAKNRIIKIDKLAEEANKCKATSNACSVELRQAIKETDNNIKAIEELIIQLKSLMSELASLSLNLEATLKNKYSANDIELAKEMIRTKQGQYLNTLGIAETVLDINKKNLISAQFLLEEFDLINQKTKENIAAGADSLSLSGNLTKLTYQVPQKSWVLQSIQSVNDSRKKLLSNTSRFINSKKPYLIAAAIVGATGVGGYNVIENSHAKQEKANALMEQRVPGLEENLRIASDISTAAEKDKAYMKIYYTYKHKLSSNELKHITEKIYFDSNRNAVLEDYSTYLNSKVR